MERSPQHAFDAEEVMAYLDGELEPSRASALAAHMESCAECKLAAKSLQQVSTHLLNFEIEPAPDKFGDAIHAAVEANRSKGAVETPVLSGIRFPLMRYRPVRVLAWTAAGAAAVLVIGFVVLSIRNISQPVAVAKLDSGRETGLAESRADISRTEISGVSPYIPKPGQRSSEKADALLRQFAESNSVAQFAQIAPSVVPPTPPPPASASSDAPQAVGSMLAQTASLAVVASNFDDASGSITKLAAAHGGYVDKLNAKTQTGCARDVSATLRIPANQLEALLADVRRLGHVEEESRSNEEVSSQYVDLQAHLRNAKAAERRLIPLLATRTGKLEEVVEAEGELTRVRGEIESMQAQSLVLVHRVSYATVEVDLSEEYHQQLQSRRTSTWTQIRNAGVEGFNNLENAVIGVLVFALNYGLAIVFWAILLGIPGWLIVRKIRRKAQKA